MTIWADCDGVLADLVTPYLGLLNMITGRAYRYDDVISVRFTDCVASVAEDRAVWDLIDRSPGWVRTLPWYDGAESGLSKLRTIGERVGCLTTPHFGPTWMPERTQWLQTRGFVKKDICFSSHKPDVAGDILIEDTLQNLVDWCAKHRSGTGILIDSPYNQGAVPLNACRVGSWSGAVELATRVVSKRKVA